MSNPTGTDHEPTVASRALVVVARRPDFGNDERPNAGFVTQLIASNRRLPAYRRAGRADPCAAVTIYSGDKQMARAVLDLIV